MAKRFWAQLIEMDEPMTPASIPGATDHESAAENLVADFVGAMGGEITSGAVRVWIDGGLAAKAGIRIAPLLPQVGSVEVISLAPREDRRDPMFVAVFDYLRRQHTMVEPLYQLEKEGKLGQAEGAVVSDEARREIERIATADIQGVAR